MKGGTRAVLCALVACCTLAPVAPAAPGEVASVAPEPAPAADTDTWIGAASAVACGFFTRATVATGGTVAGTWAGLIATCGLTIFDALFIDKGK